jgi:hypothetical protein
MAAVKFPVEALGTALSDGAWVLAPGRSSFPRGLPSASRLKSACLCTASCQQSPKFGAALLPRKSTLCFETETAFATCFQISRESRFPPQASRIWKGGLVCDLEDFDFLHCEIPRIVSITSIDADAKANIRIPIAMPFERASTQAMTGILM